MSGARVPSTLGRLSYLLPVTLGRGGRQLKGDGSGAGMGAPALRAGVHVVGAASAEHLQPCGGGASPRASTGTQRWKARVKTPTGLGCTPRGRKAAAPRTRPGRRTPCMAAAAGPLCGRTLCARGSEGGGERPCEHKWRLCAWQARPGGQVTFSTCRRRRKRRDAHEFAAGHADLH